MTADDRPRLAPISTVADQYGLSEQTILQWISDGKVAAYRIGPRTVRVDLDEVAAELERK